MAATKLIFSYNLVGEGQAECYISDGTEEARIPIWHLTPDALGDFLRAVIGQLKGSSPTRCIWEDEIAEYRWLFRIHDSLLDVNILRFNVPFSSLPDEDGEVIFASTFPFRKFTTKIRNELGRLVRDVGIEEYSRRWHGRFPSELYAELQSLLRQIPPN